MNRKMIELIVGLVNRNAPVSLKDLEKELNLTSRSIRYEIKNANDYLNSLSLSSININKEGVLINVTEREKKLLLQDIQAVIQYLTKSERVLYEALHVADAKGIKFAVQWMKALDVSKSSIDGDVRKLKKSLSDYKLELISSNKNGYSIKGDESRIRRYLQQLIMGKFENILPTSKFEKYQTPSEEIIFQYLDFDFVQKVEGVIQGLRKKYHLEVMTEPTVEQLIIFVSIWHKRILDGRFLADFVKKRESALHNFLLVEELLEELNLDVPLIEKRYLAYYFEGYTINKAILLNNRWANLQVLTISLIQKMEKKLNCPFSDDYELLKLLNQHIEGLYSRIAKDISIVNPLHSMVMSQYKEIYDALSECQYLFQNHLKNIITKDEISYIAIHFSVSRERFFRQENRLFKLLVICGHGLATGALLSENLTKNFPVEVVAIIDEAGISSFKDTNIDLAVSTITVKSKTMDVITVQPILTDYDKEKIKKQLSSLPKKNIEKEETYTQMFQKICSIFLDEDAEMESKVRTLREIFNENQLQIDEKGVQPMISDMLQESDILIGEKVDNWRDGIKSVGQVLLEKGAITEEYIDAMIHSVNEYGPYIVLAKGIALAHAKPGTHVNQLGISVATFETPIHFGHDENDPVSIMFCLASNDDYSHLNIMKFLVNIINESWKLERLIAAEDSKDFIEIINELEKGA